MPSDQKLSPIDKPKLLIMGPLPPPYIGPAVATEILLNSDLSSAFNIIHFDTNAHKSLSSIGTFQIGKVLKTLKLYLRFLIVLLSRHPSLVLVPISETSLGYIKDSAYMLLSKLTFRKTLLQLWGGGFSNWISQRNAILRSYVALTLRPMDGIIVLGEKLKYQFSPYFSPDKIYSIPNGANHNFSPLHRRAGNPVSLLFLSNLLPTKGIEDTIQALALLNHSPTKQGFVLDVVGELLDKEFGHHLLDFVRRHNLPVRFHQGIFGTMRAKFFETAEIFIFPPRAQEGHPWVIVEAMAASLPVIATDQGAITEAVFNGVNGFIVPTESPQKIAEKLRLLLDNFNLRLQMGQRSRSIYEQNFTETKMVVKYISCFNRVLNQP
jgi:glycosyltransferase involved in cell wall biosynthesis